MVYFKELTELNYKQCMRLAVKQHQLDYVSNGNYVSLAKAYIFKDSTFPFAIYNENDIVGFIQYREMHHLGNYLLEKIMISDIHQGNGYAYQAMKLLIDTLKLENRFSKLCLCVHKENTDAMKLYNKFGFTLKKDEEEEEGEIVLEISW